MTRLSSLLKKTKIIVTNSNDVTSIAIDDFATKQRYKYGYDRKTSI